MTPTELWSADTDQQVTCLACGQTLDREEAREYDKYGDRWDRDGKTFEYLCKPCDRDRCHQPRDGLEATLVAADAGRTDRESFLRRYCELDAGDTESARRRS
ncbi:DUF7562 family protein [Halapricum salinum]|uniref:Small CPxCG-related zinc finger protein n=1 Tax=Halapricum salinum TaxID=1457250 RepID=A0A4D6HCJ4_9EURY|nr:hypothetical protein [Halapricum salinum]QCC51713.1 hypothetical protein DV733_10915 [Halapricum salinum]